MIQKLNSSKKEHIERDTEVLINENFCAPLLYIYVSWVLNKAVSLNIGTLYFLARDGYLLREIAIRICKIKNLKIDCRYLYCSRASLRMPTYHFIGEEAYRLLLLGGYRLTYKSILLRAKLSEAERNTIYTNLNIDIDDENKLLSWKEFEEFREKLINCKLYKELIIQKSKEEYPSTIAYLKQEGVFDQEIFAVVDSGWSGSMQRSLRQLLESAGFKGHCVGFYFGMYLSPKEDSDGNYYTWYFEHNGNIIQKSLFSNNLFECILGANHGMTVRYDNKDGNIEPILTDGPTDNQAKQLCEAQDIILNYIEEKELFARKEICNEKEQWEMTNNLIKRYMFQPKKEEALYFGKLLFCDDMTEDYFNVLASDKQLKQLDQYLILKRLKHRFFPDKEDTVNELFWPYGTIAFLPKWQQPWYRINVFIWQMFKYFFDHV